MSTDAKYFLGEAGYYLQPSLLNEDEIIALTAAIEAINGNTSHMRESVYAIRNPHLAAPDLVNILKETILPGLAESLFEDEPRIVRSLYFDKPVDANWRVPWHQDRVVALAEMGDAPGFQAWSTKDGIPHAQAPVALLERMVTIRIHIDDCDAANGALHVVPGSHRGGFLGPKEIMALRNEHGDYICKVPRGGAMLMKPLLPHASNPATTPRHRRVLHLELADCAPAPELAWHAPAFLNRSSARLPLETFHESKPIAEGV